MPFHSFWNSYETETSFDNCFETFGNRVQQGLIFMSMADPSSSTSHMYYEATWIWTWFRSSSSTKSKPNPGNPQSPPLPRPHPHQGGRPARARVKSHSTPLYSHLSPRVIDALAGGGSPCLWRASPRPPSPPQHPPPHHIPTPPHYLKGYKRIERIFCQSLL